MNDYASRRLQGGSASRVKARGFQPKPWARSTSGVRVTAHGKPRAMHTKQTAGMGVDDDDGEAQCSALPPTSDYMEDKA